VRHNFIDRYAVLDSPLHTLEPRTKLIAFTALIIAVLCIPVNSGSLFILYFFTTAILMGISQIPLNYILGRILIMLPFIVLASLAVPWKGYQGLWILFVRAILCLILLILLTNTTRFVELLRGLRRMGCPQILVMNLSFLYRYLFVRDCRRVGQAPFREELKVLSSMLGTLLIRSFERAERMHSAMLSRCYTGTFPVVSPKRFSWRDLLFVSGVMIFVALSFHLV
jgi:cobalt/nickel transport system permease protein